MSKAGNIITELSNQKVKYLPWSRESGQKLLDEIVNIKTKYKDDRTIKDLLWYFGYIVDSVAKGDKEGVIEYARNLYNDFKRGIPDIE